MTQKIYSYLALGDSYTIGEGVDVSESFPHQLVQVFKERGYEFQTPEIVAKTGWTTGELQSAINNAQLNRSYDFVTLLIGVNNQYRGLSIEDYENQFESLLKKSILLAGNTPLHVFVLSIPDWGVTPFAEAHDRKKIAAEIDKFNAVNRKIATKFQVNYVDITPYSREAAFDHTLLTADRLHPSGKEYARWVDKLRTKVMWQLS
jgi:lysophospholipase L1-like esterase